LQHIYALTFTSSVGLRRAAAKAPLAVPANTLTGTPVWLLLLLLLLLPTEALLSMLLLLMLVLLLMLGCACCCTLAMVFFMGVYRPSRKPASTTQTQQ